jgi:hypothetical protein
MVSGDHEMKKCCICGQAPNDAYDPKDKYPLCKECLYSEGLFHAWLMRKTAGHNAWVAALSVLCQSVLMVVMAENYLNSRGAMALLVCPIMCASCVALWCFVVRDRLRERKRYAEEYFLLRLKGPPAKSSICGWTTVPGKVGIQGAQGSCGPTGVVGTSSQGAQGASMSSCANWTPAKPTNPHKGYVFIDPQAKTVEVWNGHRWETAQP